MADDFLKNLSPEARAALENVRNNLRKNQAELKPDSYGPEPLARRAEQIRTGDKKLDETMFPNQRGAQLIQQKREDAGKSKASKASPESEKGPRGKDADNER